MPVCRSSKIQHRLSKSTFFITERKKLRIQWKTLYTVDEDTDFFVAKGCKWSFSRGTNNIIASFWCYFKMNFVLWGDLAKYLFWAMSSSLSGFRECSLGLLRVTDCNWWDTCSKLFSSIYIHNSSSWSWYSAKRGDKLSVPQLIVFNTLTVFSG